MSQQSSRGRFSRILITIGGVAGIVAICGLLIAVVQLWQSVYTQNEDNKAQATEVAYDKAQVDALVEIVALQKLLVEQVPDATATVIVGQIANLQATVEANNNLYPIPTEDVPSTRQTSIQPLPTYTPYPTYTPPPTQISEPQPTLAIQPTSSPQNTAPFRDHQIASIGTGYFTEVTYSDGEAAFSQDDLNSNHFRIQVIHKEDQNACGVSVYEVDKVWVASSANTIFTVNGQEIGKLSVDTGKHGYIVNWSVHIGDELCAVGFTPSGFGIIIGSDMYYHYDSYCYRGWCS